MKLPGALFLSFCAVMLPCQAATLVVEPRPSAKYSTIQSAVNAAQPGDIVEIRSGVYFEHVEIRKGGEPGRPIVIQGAPNALVVVNAGQRLEAQFTPVKDYPEVYSAPVPAAKMKEETALWEMPARMRMKRVFSVEQVAQRIGSWFYDPQQERLYVRSTGSRKADQAAYWLESSNKAAITVNTSYVTLRNLETTLGQHGILVTGKDRHHVTIENCRAYCNSWAGIHITGDDHLVANNDTFFNNTYGIQLRYGVNRVKIVGNRCLFNGPNNGDVTPGTSVPTDLGIYSLGDYNIIERNIVEGLHEDVYRNKTGHGARKTNILRHNVIIGDQTPGPYGVYHNTLWVSGLGMREGMYRNGGPASVMRSWELVDPQGLQRAWNLIYPLCQKEDPRFADVSYRDYRLQEDSPHVGRGAYPSLEPVFYVDPKNGSDQNSGRSEKAPFATLKAALNYACAGATLYLLPGEYTETVEIQDLGGVSAEEPLRIRAHGKREGVKIKGSLVIKKGRYVSLEGLEFEAPLDVQDTRDVALLECLFIGKDSGVRMKGAWRAKIDHCTFVENQEALQLNDSREVRVTHNLFVQCGTSLSAKKGEEVSSDFNAFTRFSARVGEKAWDGLKPWQEEAGQDGHSLETPVQLEPGYRLPGLSPLASHASDFGAIGARVELLAASLKVQNLKVAGLSPNTATLQWQTSQPTFGEITLKDEKGAVLRSWDLPLKVQVMASSYDVNRFSNSFYTADRYAGLGDLEPGKTYQATVVARDMYGHRSEPASLTFRTPKEEAKATRYYLSPTGSDSKDGKSAQTAWRTFYHATAQMRPGDELILLPGVYQETIRPRVAGSKDRRITIRAQEPGKAVIDLGMTLPGAVEISNVDYITIDGLIARNSKGLLGYYYLVNHGRGITVQNCEIDFPEGWSMEKLKGGSSGLLAHEAPELKVLNNLFIGCTVNIAVSNAPGAVVSGNSLLGEGNYGVVIIPGASDEEYTVENNLFYRVVFGYKSNPNIWVFPPMPKLVSDYNLFYIPKAKPPVIPKDHNGTIGVLPGTERLVPLQAWQTSTGLDIHSIQAEPEFENPAQRDFRLKPSSPGWNGAKDGGPIGYRGPMLK